MKPFLVVFLLLVVSLPAQDVNQDGIPVLVRPEIKKPETAPKPPPKSPKVVDKAPLAEEAKRLREWETSLTMTADSLAERLRALAERERLLAEKERSFETRRAALEVRKTAIALREEAMKLPGASPPSSPLDAINEEMVVSNVEVKRWTGPNAPSIVGGKAMVIDAANGRILHNKDGGDSVSGAELLQLMTALVICEDGNLDQKVKITDEDTEVAGDKMGLKSGLSFSRAELLQWLLVASGNDVANALARDNAGSVDAFVAKMNARGKLLRLNGTTFTNPSGEDADGQKTTTRDLALLAWECYHQSFIREAVKTKSFKLSVGSETKFATNGNKLLSQMTSCSGMKFGKSTDARTVLITSAERQGRERIIVVLESTDSWVFKDSKVLIDWSLSSD